MLRKYAHIILGTMAVLWCAVTPRACAQDTDSDPFSDSEESLPPMPGKNNRPVTLALNGVAQPLEEGAEVVFSTETRVVVAVRNLYPNSIVSMQVQKAGIKGKASVLQANEKGELDLEANTGKTRVAGTALLEYVDAMGRTQNLSVRIKIQ